jgi:hypothetical protein
MITAATRAAEKLLRFDCALRVVDCGSHDSLTVVCLSIWVRYQTRVGPHDSRDEVAGGIVAAEEGEVKWEAGFVKKKVVLFRKPTKTLPVPASSADERRHVPKSWHSAGEHLRCEFPWACGPPMEMKAAFPRPINSKPWGRSSR